MRYVSLAFVFSVAAYPAVFIVCEGGATQNSGGPYGNCSSPSATRRSWQAAIDAANPGDTIVAPAGHYRIDGTLYIPPMKGSDWITIQPQNPALTPGYRAKVSDLPNMVVFEGVARMSDGMFALSRSYARTPSLASPGVLGATISETTATLGGSCTESTPCFFRPVDNGDVLSVTAPLGTITLREPPPKASSLAVGLTSGGQIILRHDADMRMGVHFTCEPACIDDGKYQTTFAEFPKANLPFVRLLYSTTAFSSRWDARVWLSGPDATWHQGFFRLSPAETYYGPPAGPGYWRFKQIGLTVSEGLNYAIPVFFAISPIQSDGAAGAVDFRDAPHHIEFDQVVLSLSDSTYGMRGFLLAGGPFSITNSTLSKIKATNELQGIAITHGPGPVVLDNVEMDSSCENLMTGGARLMLPYIPSLDVRRVYSFWRLDYWHNFRLVRNADRTRIDMKTHSGRACHAATGQDTCFYHYNDERRQIAEETYAVVAGGENASGMVRLYRDRDSSNLYLGHNLTAGTLTCSGGMTCIDGVSAFPPGSIPYSVWRVANGQFASQTEGSGAFFFSLKNLWEYKFCENCAVRGSVFRNHWNAGQTDAITITPRGESGMMQYSRVNNLVFESNRFEGMNQGIVLYGGDETCHCVSFRNVRIVNNLFNDLGAARWHTAPVTTGMFLRYSTSSEADVFHNTARVDYMQVFSDGFGTTPAPRPNGLNNPRMNMRNNLIVWGPRGGALAGNSCFAGFTTNYAPSTCVNFREGSAYENNLNISEGPIPNQQNYANNTLAPWQPLSSHFQSVSATPSYADNLRLIPSSPYSVHCEGNCVPVTDDGLDPGADIDLIDSLTDGVVEGLPELRKRWDVVIETAQESATISMINLELPTQVEVSRHQNMTAANVVLNTATPSEANTDRRSFHITGLAPGTEYWYTIRAGSQVVKGTFTTAE